MPNAESPRAANAKGFSRSLIRSLQPKTGTHSPPQDHTLRHLANLYLPNAGREIALKSLPKDDENSKQFF